MDKAQVYKDILRDFDAIIEGENNLIARMATLCSLLVSEFGERFFWCGFYLVDESKLDELVIGPYQGTLGCLRIPFSRGVCGACATRKETIIVDDVHVFEGHIACDSRSNSEIVVPVFDGNGILLAVLDVDSTKFAEFDSGDKIGLEALCALLAP